MIEIRMAAIVTAGVVLCWTAAAASCAARGYFQARGDAEVARQGGDVAAIECARSHTAVRREWCRDYVRAMVDKARVGNE